MNNNIHIIIFITMNNNIYIIIFITKKVIITFNKIFHAISSVINNFNNRTIYANTTYYYNKRLEFVVSCQFLSIFKYILLYFYRIVNSLFPYYHYPANSSD